MDGVLARQRAARDDRRPVLRRPARGEEGIDHAVQLSGPGVADDRAVEARDGVPVEPRRAAAAVLVPAHERQRVAGAGIRDGHPGVAGRRDGGGDTRHDLEADALFVEEQGLLAAAVEHVGVAPFQTHDRLALARLLGEQQADRILLQRLRGRGADVDALGIGTGAAKQPRVHEVIVHHHVGRGEVPQPAHRDQRGVAGSSANDVDSRGLHCGTVYAACRLPPTGVRG